MVQTRSFIVIVSLLALANSLPYPAEYDIEENANEKKIILVYPDYLRQIAPVGGVLGALGTALVPVVGAVIGPVLTNLVAGITQAFNNGVNSLNNGSNTSTSTTTPRPTRPSRRPNRRPSRPAPHDQIDIPTEGLPEFEGFMIRLPGVDRPYLFLAPPGTHLSDLPITLPKEDLNTETIVGVERHETSVETDDPLEQPTVPLSRTDRPSIKLKRSGYYLK